MGLSGRELGGWKGDGIERVGSVGCLLRDVGVYLREWK